MKRALIVLLLLAVAAGGLFAQVTYSGFVNSGFQVVIPPNEGDITFHWYSNDPGATYRFQFRAAYQNDDGTVGAAGSIRSNAGGFGFDGSNGWIKLLDKQLHISVGNGSAVGGFGSLGNFGAANTAADGRFSAAFTPTDTNFSIGLGINPASSNGANTFALATYGLGLKFGIPGTLTAVANANFVPDTSVVNAAAGISIAALNAASSDSGINGIAVDLIANDVTGDLKWVGIGPVVGFRVVGVGAGNLGISLRSRIFVPLTDENELDYWVGLDLGVPLTSAISFNLNGGYEANAAIGGPNADTGILGAANGEGTGRAIGGSGDAGLIVRPQLTFNLGSGASIIAGWSLQALLASEMVMQHAIYGRLVVSF